MVLFFMEDLRNQWGISEKLGVAWARSRSVEGPLLKGESQWTGPGGISLGFQGREKLNFLFGRCLFMR